MEEIEEDFARLVGCFVSRLMLESNKAFIRWLPDETTVVGSCATLVLLKDNVSS